MSPTLLASYKKVAALPKRDQREVVTMLNLFVQNRTVEDVPFTEEQLATIQKRLKEKNPKTITMSQLARRLSRI